MMTLKLCIQLKGEGFIHKGVSSLLILFGMIVPLEVWPIWSVQTTPTSNNLYAVCYPVDYLTGYAVGNSGTILKTQDGGNTWNLQVPPTGANVRSIHFPEDGNTGYAVGYSGTILKTTSGGTTWTLQFSGTNRRLYDVFFLSNSAGYAVGDIGVILKTTNGGASWTQQSTPINNDLKSVHFPVDASTGYAVGELGRVLKTIDGGNTWVNLSSGTSVILWSVHFPMDQDTGFVVGDGGLILKTTDGGATWNSQTSGTTQVLRAVSFPQNTMTGYIVGYGGTVLKTKNGGTDWTPQTSGTSNDLRAAQFLDVYTGYASGNSGTILYTADGGGEFLHDGGILSIEAPGDTVFTNSIVTPVTTVKNFGNIVDTFTVIANIGGYTDTVQVMGIPPDSVNQVIFADWQIPPGDSATYTMEVCLLVSGDLDPTNDCLQKTIFAHEGVSPRLLSAVASDNLIPVPGIDYDDQVLILFDESTNRPVIDASNINIILALSGGHTWTDGSGFIGGTVWNMSGDGLWIILSTNSGLPSVSVGDTIVPDGVTIQDVWGNPAVSPAIISGSFDPPTGEEESIYKLPIINFNLFQNSPNPFQISTLIRYEIPSHDHVQLKIYDTKGNLVETLVNERLKPGIHQVEWNGRDLNSGIYFFRLILGREANLLNRTKKVILIR